MLVKQAGNPDVWPRREPLGAAIRRTPGVESVVLDDRYPGRGGFGRSETFTRAGLADEKAPSLSWELFNEGYLQTYQMRPVAGRPLSLANGMDDKAGLNEEGLAKRGLNVLVNASATRALGFAKPADAVGQLIRSGSGAPTRIVGVLPDIRFGSPRDKVAPIIYSRDTAPNANSPGDPTFVVRYRGDPRTVMAGLKAAWRSVVPDAPFEGVTVEKSLSQFYEPESSGSRLLTLGAIVAVLIGCLGLYGLAAFSSQRRTREIGIRKVLGASAGDVIRLLVAQFLRPVAVANLIAWPVAFFAMRSWLSAFDQRIALGPHFFLLASGLALLVALATVIFQTLRVARAEPARALRYE